MRCYHPKLFGLRQFRLNRAKRDDWSEDDHSEWNSRFDGGQEMVTFSNVDLIFEMLNGLSFALTTDWYSNTQKQGGTRGSFLLFFPARWTTKSEKSAFRLFRCQIDSRERNCVLHRSKSFLEKFLHVLKFQSRSEIFHHHTHDAAIHWNVNFRISSHGDWKDIFQIHRILDPRTELTRRTRILVRDFSHQGTH